MKGYHTKVDNVTTKTPTFLVIGAAKSGTTALWHYLKQHPQIFMSPRKHTRFFAFIDEEPNFRGPKLERESTPYAIPDLESYLALFSGITDEKAVGEVSHSYLYVPETPARIKSYLPEVKLIAVLRHPVERAYSHYRQMVRDGRESIPDFILALEAEEERVRDDWWPDFHYVRIGLYHAQLERYLRIFDRGQIRVYLYEDLEHDPQVVLRDMFGFLEIDETFVPETKVRYNASGIPKHRVLHQLLQTLRRARPIAERHLSVEQYRHLLRFGSGLHNWNLAQPQLSPDTRRRVVDRYFRKDILELQSLIRRDLSAWLE